MLVSGMNLELMQEVKRRVLEQPEMVNMCKWQETAYKTETRFFFFEKKEPCGTIGCIAGHAIAARGGNVTHVPVDGRGRNDNIEELAMNLLEITWKEADFLFYFHSTGNHASPYRKLQLEISMFSPGTAEYAAVVARAIDLCIARDGGANDTDDDI